MIDDKEISLALHNAYVEAGNNAYFGNGFMAGVKFAEKFLEKNNKKLNHKQALCAEASWCCEFRRNKCNGEACPAYTPEG